MVLPNSQPTQRSKKDNNFLDNSTQSSQPKSYVNALKGTNEKHSLLHSDISEVHPDADSPVKTVTSRIYRSSRTEGAYLFDISHCFPHYTEKQVIIMSKEQYPNAHSCVSSKDGNKKYIELYIEQEDDTNDIAASGLTFTKINLQVLPCPAVMDASQVVNITLSNLPLLKKEKVLQGLKASLSPFGNLLDVGILLDKDSQYFMGEGYAVLDICSGSKEPYKQLTHIINWNESADNAFRATWNNMPTWCRYCHKEGHTKFECEMSKAKIICYSCHQHGHRSYECPRKPINIKSFKKARKERRPERNAISTTSTASKELMKSIYASKPDPNSVVDSEDDEDYTPPVHEDDEQSDNMSVLTNQDDDLDEIMEEIEELEQEQAEHNSQLSQNISPTLSHSAISPANTGSTVNVAQKTITQTSSNTMASAFFALGNSTINSQEAKVDSPSLGTPPGDAEFGTSLN